MKKCVALIALLGCLETPAQGSPSSGPCPDMLENIKECAFLHTCVGTQTWLDPRLYTPNLASQLGMTCLREAEIDPIACFMDKDGDKVNFVLDPGYSFGRLDGPLVEALVFVRGIYEARRHQALEKDPTLTGAALDALCRVKIMDLGAGHGYDLWKFVVAGAHVTVVESHPALLDGTGKVNVPWKTLEKALPFMPAGVKRSDVSRFVAQDALKALSIPHYQGSFDGVWASNILHYMAPPMALECVKKIGGVLKEDGKLWACVHGGFFPSALGKSKEIYLAQAAEGKPFPGYMMLNMHTQTTSKRSSMPRFFPLEASDSFIPSQLYCSSYVKGDTRTRHQQFEDMIAQNKKTGVQEQHRSLFLFDPKSFTGLLKDAPFKIESLGHVIAGILMPVLDHEEVYGSADEGAKQLSLTATKVAHS